MDKVFAAVTRLLPRQARLLRHQAGLEEWVAALKEMLHADKVLSAGSTGCQYSVLVPPYEGNGLANVTSLRARLTALSAREPSLQAE